MAGIFFWKRYIHAQAHQKNSWEHHTMDPIRSIARPKDVMHTQSQGFDIFSP